MICGGRGEKGYTVVILATLLVAVGLFAAGSFALLKSVDRESQEDATRRNMSRIVYALSVYVQKHSRLPCPADPDMSAGAQPFGAERGSGANGDSYGSCNPSERLGIVPFKTLGLPEFAVRDGWRNFITYRVSSTFATFDPTVPPGHYPRVHEICREKDVWVFPSAGPPAVMNKNPNKAIFCCGLPEPGFDVVDPDGNSLVYSGVMPGDYKMLHVPVPHVAAGADLPDMLAVVLVSHGANGHGAYLGNGTRIDLGGVAAAEAENADNDGAFVAAPRTEAASAYFDDILAWRTQHHLMTEVGNYYAGCTAPGP